MDPNHVPTRRSYLPLLLIPAGIAINLGLGSLATALKLPVYLDAIGTISFTMLFGFRVGLAVGVSSFLIGGLLTNPVLPWFIGTQAAIATYIWVLTKYKFIAQPTTPRSRSLTARLLIAGIGLGVVAGVASAPVIVYLFGGITGSGPSLVVAILLRSGRQLLNAVLLSGLASEPLDKTLQLFAAYFIASTIPPRLLDRLRKEQ